jgi:hypothetical protein
MRVVRLKFCKSVQGAGREYFYSGESISFLCVGYFEISLFLTTGLDPHSPSLLAGSYNRKPMLLRPLPDDKVIRLSQTDCFDVRRARK